MLKLIKKIIVDRTLYLNVFLPVFLKEEEEKEEEKTPLTFGQLCLLCNLHLLRVKMIIIFFV